MLLDYLDRSAVAAKPSAGLVYRGSTTSYAELSERAHGIAAGLSRREVGVGSRVGVLSANCPDAFALLFGIAGVGAAAVFLNPAAPTGELEWIIRKADIGFIIADRQFEKTVTAVTQSLEKTRTVPVHYFSRLEAESLDTLLASPSTRIDAVGETQTAAFMFSSGSTGRPKLVPHTHATLVGNAANSARVWDITGDDVAFNPLPISHSLGLTQMVREVLFAGATTVIWDDPRPLILARNAMVETISETGVTIFPGVPFMFKQLIGATSSARTDAMRVCFAGGAALSRDLFDAFGDRFGIPLRRAYGTTETSMLSINLERDVDPTWDSVGRPIDGVEFDLVPSPECPGEDRGELFVRAPSLSPGYVDADAQSMMQFRNGGFQPGDFARIDKDGHVYILGRAKLIYDVAGEKVDPLEVEDVLVSHPAVSEAVVVGLPCGTAGDVRLKAVLVGDPGAGREEEIRTYCADRLVSFKVPELFEFRDAIPRSATGKILRGKLMD